jgi:hypothetical protein
MGHEASVRRPPSRPWSPSLSHLAADLHFELLLCESGRHILLLHTRVGRSDFRALTLGPLPTPVAGHSTQLTVLVTDKPTRLPRIVQVYALPLGFLLFSATHIVSRHQTRSAGLYEQCDKQAGTRQHAQAAVKGPAHTLSAHTKYAYPYGLTALHCIVLQRTSQPASQLASQSLSQVDA